MTFFLIFWKSRRFW